MNEGINLEQDAQGVQVSDDKLARVASLAEQQVSLETQIAGLAELMAELGEQLKRVQEYELPDAMTEAGVSEFKLVNGSKVTIKPFYNGKIDETNRDNCHKWLVDNEHEDLIKTEVTVPIGRGGYEQAQKLMDGLKQQGYSYTYKEGVHHSTLNAFIKEQVEAGANFPLELFKAFIGRKAKIKTK